MVPDEDALQENGMDESVPDVPEEAEKQTEGTEVFQEQRGREPRKDGQLEWIAAKSAHALAHTLLCFLCTLTLTATFP